MTYQFADRRHVGNYHRHSSLMAQPGSTGYGVRAANTNSPHAVFADATIAYRYADFIADQTGLRQTVEPGYLTTFGTFRESGF